MNAREFFNAQSSTDATNCILDKYRQKYSRQDLIRFAQAYHDSEVKKSDNTSEETPPEETPPDQRVFLAIQTVTGRTKEDYSIKTRKRDILYCRQVAHRLLKEKTKMSLSEIGRLVGGKDHSTVIHSIRTIEREREFYEKTGSKQDLLILYEKCRNEVEKIESTDKTQTT